MRRQPFRKDALKRAHDAISRLIAEAAEPAPKRHVVWGNDSVRLGEMLEEIKANYEDFNVGSFYEVGKGGKPIFDNDKATR